MKTDVNLFEPFKHVSMHQYAHSHYAKRARLSLHLPNAYVLATLSAHASRFLLTPVVIVNQSWNNVVFDTCRFEIKLRTNLTQQIFPRCCDLTHKVNGLRLEVVLYQVTPYKAAKTISNKVVHIRMVGAFG